MTDELERRIVKVYKNWSIDQTAQMLKVGKKKVLEVLKKRGVQIRKAGWRWRHT